MLKGQKCAGTHQAVPGTNVGGYLIYNTANLKLKTVDGRIARPMVD